MSQLPSGFPRFGSPLLLLAAAAIALRLLLFLGRGDYLAFDEGFYLLLARSLFTGDGFSLIGVPHTALSPLYPVLAGAMGTLLDSWVWGGRVVAAVASGLLVLPAWSIFRRLAPPKTAFVGAALVAVLPSLAPFVVPFWIGADLWVGAGPLFHLLLYCGIAAWLSGAERGGSGRWALSGGLFGLAFLTRPEAILPWGLLGLAALAIAARRRSLERLRGAAVMGVALVIVAAPYWVYLHNATGRWMLTGRGVAPAAAAAQLVTSPERAGAAGTIERMLWSDDPRYEQRLYGLGPSGLRLRSGYWGVQPPAPNPGLETSTGQGADGARRERASPPARDRRQQQQPHPPVEAELPDEAELPVEADPPGPIGLYVRSMGQIVPLLLWPFILLGAVGPRRAAEGGRAREGGVLHLELPIAIALIGTSLAIAALVAVDPRTQLFLVPLLALYAARGFALVDDAIQERLDLAELRPGFIRGLLAAVAVVWLLGINAQRLYRSLAYGSPHHAVAEQNRAVAEALDSLTGGTTGPVASWHPAIAVYADRDWRVLPFASLPEIVRYEAAAGARVMVLSAYYPPPLGVESLETRYLVLPVPDSVGPPREWSVQIQHGDSIRAVGSLRPRGPPAEAPSR